MMPKVSATVLGAGGLEAWLESADTAYRTALRESTKAGVQIEKAAIKRGTPVETGELQENIDARVSEEGENEVRGEVFSPTDYALFVEVGTKEHGEARHMFRSGAEETEGEVLGLFENSMRPITASFSRGL